MPSRLPEWARELRTLYESGVASQFILHGNIHDRVLIPDRENPRLGSLEEFLVEVLLPGFDVVLTYDLGNGIRVEKGGQLFGEWPTIKRGTPLPTAPRAAVQTLTHYFRYVANLANLGQRKVHVGLILRGTQLVCPAVQGGVHHELSALAVLMRDWSSDPSLASHPLATFLLTEGLNDLNPIVSGNPRAPWVEVPLPSHADLERTFQVIAPQYPTALAHYTGDLGNLAGQLTGTTLTAAEALLKTREHAGSELQPDDVLSLKKELVEKSLGGLIDFIESERTLDDLLGQERLVQWLRQDLALWHQGDLRAMPMGYLLSGPVGTGKTFLVKCLAGEAGVPVVVLRNFRDKWIGSTEANLEKIFRLLHALGRAIVFIDEADQALGRRGGGDGDSGLSGRIYSMIAQEMSQSSNRGRIVWVLASSRPDLIEVDLKRPGRIDVKIPLFPLTNPQAAARLLGGLCRRMELDLAQEDIVALEHHVPGLLTPGAAEALSVKAYRMVKTRKMTPIAALLECLEDYQSPVPEDVMEHQIRLAIRETTDIDFIPPRILDLFG